MSTSQIDSAYTYAPAPTVSPILANPSIAKPIKYNVSSGALSSHSRTKISDDSVSMRVQKVHKSSLRGILSPVAATAVAKTKSRRSPQPTDTR